MIATEPSVANRRANRIIQTYANPEMKATLITTNRKKIRWLCLMFSMLGLERNDLL